MKKTFAVVLALGLMLTSVAACAPAAPAPEAPAEVAAPEAAQGEAPKVEETKVEAPKAEQLNLIMATGGTSGTYYPYGGAVAAVYNSTIPGMNMNVQATGASGENIRLIAGDEVDIAIVQNDVMDYAFNGIETFKEAGKVDQFSTMATLYSEVCQIVADPASGIETIADLKGKRVSVGDVGSGVEANARQILGAYGITFEDIKTEHLGFGPSADAMKDKKIDAFFVTAGAPTTAIMELATTNSIKLIPIAGAEADQLLADFGYYTKYTVKGGTYSGVDADTETLAVKATFIVSKTLSDDTVYAMTKALFDNAEEITAGHAKGSELDPKLAVEGVSVPFHPGAEKYFKEIGSIQ